MAKKYGLTKHEQALLRKAQLHFEGIVNDENI